MPADAFKKDAEKYFAYRHQPRTFHGLIEVPFIKRFIREELDVAGADVLDLGCGFGFYAKCFLEQKARSLECIDKSPAMIELGRKYAPDPRTRFKVLDIKDFRARNRFDIAFANLSLSDVGNLEGVYRNVRNALRRDGLFLVSEVHPVSTVLRFSGKKEYATFGRNYFHTPVGMQDYLNTAIRAGFKVKTYREPEPDSGSRQAGDILARANLFPRFFVLLLQKE